MRRPSLHAVGRRLRSRLFRLWIYDLPLLLASLVQGRGEPVPLVLLITGIVLFLVGLFPLPVSDSEPLVEFRLGPFRIVLPIRALARYGMGLGFVLIGAGIVIWMAGRWGASRAGFWRALEDLGVRVVWDGEAEGFRERLDAAMGFALGRGPSGRLLPLYVPRREEEEALRILQEHVWGSEKQAYGVVIAGPPAAGKTRTAMELAIRLNPPLVLVWPRGRKEGAQPFPRGIKMPIPRAPVLADDLPLRPRGEGPSLPEGLMDLLWACPDLALLATARTDRIPPDVREVRVVELQAMGREDCQGLAQAVAEAEGRRVEEVWGRFAGHPGSLVAGLDVFKQCYRDLPAEMGRVLGVQEAARRDRLGEMGQRFLQSARALWDLGVRTLTLERVWGVVERAGGAAVTPADRDPVLRALETLAFLRVERKKRGEVARFYEGILTKAIPPPEAEWERTARETLRERKDAAAFIEIGNTWAEEYSPAYQRNPREALRRAIAAYEEALRFYTPDVAPLDYARTQNNLGIAYSDLAAHEDPVGNLRRAIVAYEEALRFYTPDVAPLDYAATQNNLGIAYSDLAAHEDPVGNLRRAIVAYEEALRFYTPDVAPLDYARTQNNLGSAYSALAAHEDPVGNLRRAIVAYEEALRFYTPDVAPLDYAATQNNLGIAYRQLSEHEDPVGNIERALQAFREALRFRTPERTPLFYAEAQHEIGRAYQRRAELQADPARRCADLQAAVRAFREALRFRTPEATPRGHEETRKALEEAEEALRGAGCPEAG